MQETFAFPVKTRRILYKLLFPKSPAGLYYPLGEYSALSSAEMKPSPERSGGDNTAPGAAMNRRMPMRRRIPQSQRLKEYTSLQAGELYFLGTALGTNDTGDISINTSLSNHSAQDCFWKLRVHKTEEESPMRHHNRWQSREKRRGLRVLSCFIRKGEGTVLRFTPSEPFSPSVSEGSVEPQKKGRTPAEQLESVARIEALLKQSAEQREHRARPWPRVLSLRAFLRAGQSWV